MKNPLLAGEIIEKTAKAIKKPVTVKIRKGFDDDHINAVEMAHIAAGVRCGSNRGTWQDQSSSSILEKRTGISSVR